MNRIKELRAKKGIKQIDLAKVLSVSQAALSGYETGKYEADLETYKRIAEYFGVSVDYLLGGPLKPSHSQGLRIPVLGSVAAGIPIEAIEEIIDYEELDAEEFGHGEYFGLKISGHSMEPKISDGDVVIVKRQPDVETGEIAVVLVNGDDATVKRIKKSPQGVTLLPSNPAYEPMYFTNEEIERLPVVIVGKVVELRAKL